MSSITGWFQTYSNCVKYIKVNRKLLTYRTANTAFYINCMENLSHYVVCRFIYDTGCSHIIWETPFNDLPYRNGAVNGIFCERMLLFVLSLVFLIWVWVLSLYKIVGFIIFITEISRIIQCHKNECYVTQQINISLLAHWAKSNYWMVGNYWPNQTYGIIEHVSPSHMLS